MATEKGTVTRVSTRTAWVKTTRSSACESCSARGYCHTLGGNLEEMEVEVLNPLGARVGDRVILDLKGSSLVKMAFMLYVFPVLCMLAGALVGQRYSSADSLLPIGTGAAAFCLAFVFVRFQSNRMACNPDYRPRISRILPPQPPSA